jgi:Bacterial SH3 domain
MGKTAGGEMMRLDRLGLAALLWLLMQTVALAGEAGTALKADTIRAEPFSDAKTVAKLATGDKVDILKKDGGWLQINSTRGKGWVRMLSIRKGDAKKGSGDASGLLGLASGRAGTGKVVATTGIRGLNEEDLKAAKFNAEELKKAESYAVKKTDARKFASQGKLAARPFDYLPDAQ